MDSLVPAFIAVLIASATDRPAWLAAILAERYRAPVRIFLAFLVSASLLAAIAVAGASIVRPMMTTEARTLLLALALGSAGGAMLFAPKEPDRLSGWRLGALGTGFAGGFILSFGDRSQFLIFALAVSGAYPALAGLGGALAGVLAIVPALLLGEAAWRTLPLRLASGIAGVLFLIVAVVKALEAFRLI